LGNILRLGNIAGEGMCNTQYIVNVDQLRGIKTTFVAAGFMQDLKREVAFLNGLLKFPLVQINAPAKDLRINGEIGAD
jgi:hypothetical protein